MVVVLATGSCSSVIVDKEVVVVALSPYAFMMMMMLMMILQTLLELPVGLGVGGLSTRSTWW